MPPLRALVAAGHEVVVAVTRPDRRRGRGGGTSPSPVKAAATELGIPVVHDHRELAGAGVDLGVVVAYGRILPADLLAVVPMVNLHFSLLPRWRGAAPVERTVLAGDRETGVCLMRVDEGLDTGPVYARVATAVGDDEPLEDLRARLVALGSTLLVDTLAGALPAPVVQEGEPTYADKVDPGELVLRWAGPAEELRRTVRLGRAWTTFRGRRLRVLQARPVPGPAGAPGAPAPSGTAPGAPAPAGTAPGTTAPADAPGTTAPPGTPGTTPPAGASGTTPPPGTLVGDTVATGNGWLCLIEVQPEGREPMAAADWLRGARPAPGERLGAVA